MHVAALYRYPVKGFTAEECESLSVLDEGRIAGTGFSVFDLPIRQSRAMPGARNTSSSR